MTSMKQMERELHLKQLQINRLLTITQAINDNVSAASLYNMYNSFLSWEMGVRKMALFVKNQEEWSCASFIGIPEDLTQGDVTDILVQYQRLKNIDGENTHPLIAEFDIVIPVLHKQTPIAYTFIGGFEEDEDMYNKVQFITTITNVIAVAIENKRLFRQQLEQERLRREMELASEMQQMLVPNILPQNAGFEMASIYKPHLGVGGDYFDYIQLEDDKFVFCVADISGKGVAAALLMANFQANFHTLIKKREPLDIFVRELNESLFGITKGDKFLTFFVGLYDQKNRLLQYVNAGHNRPILVMNGEAFQLDKGCTILGSFPVLPEVEVGEVEVRNEAVLVTYTDGLTDIQNPEGAYFDEECLQEFICKHYTFSATAINQRLLAEIETFRDGTSFPDDCTVLTCKVF